MRDPYLVPVSTAGLSRLAAALRIINDSAELNPRYRRMLTDALRSLDATEIRQTQARGLAKKLLVLAKAAGEDFRTGLPRQERDALDAGVSQATELLRDSAADDRHSS